MRRRAARPRRRASAAALGLAVLLACGAPEPRPAPDAPTRMRLAVIGNSDSHAYHDSVSFAPGTPERGGAERATTFQWTEILARLRGDAIDQGAWGARGASPRRARVAALVGVALRSPRKQDYAYNVAYSGARCADLSGPRGQLAQLRHAIEAERDAWKGGVVVVRIGINDLGQRELMEAVARDALTDAQRGIARACTDTIIAAARALRAAQPELRIALVGILDNANWPPFFDLFGDSASLGRLRTLLDGYDDALRDFARATPGVAFIDDRAWYRAQWGERGPAGERAYAPRTVAGLTVTLSQGDGLGHAFVADGHAGTVFNALWAQRLVAELNAQLDTRIAPITDDEIARFIGSLRPR